MEAVKSVDIMFNVFFTLAPDGGEWQDSFGHYTTRKGAPSIQWIQGYVGCRVKMVGIKFHRYFTDSYSGSQNNRQ
jgi:hypothetical protein